MSNKHRSSDMETLAEVQEAAINTEAADKAPALDTRVVDVSTITEYGLTQKLSNSIRCF
jgi:hypothetical protein